VELNHATDFVRALGAGCADQEGPSRVTIRDGKVDIALPTTRSPRSRVAASLMRRMWPGSPIRVGVEKRILPALLTRRRQPFVHEVDQQIGREAIARRAAILYPAGHDESRTHSQIPSR
jgi:hypothetical protein